MEELVNLFGLTKNEAKIYTYLLKKGSTTTGNIIKDTNIVNSRVYDSLNNLIKKGLVSYTLQKNGKHYNAENPKKFQEIEDEREKKAKAIINDLIRIKPNNNEEINSAVYEGIPGFKTAFEKIVDDCSKGETIYILGFSEQTYAIQSLRNFLIKINKKSVQKQQKLKLILDVLTKKTFGKDRESEKNTEVKYMPKGYISPAAIDIFGEYVYIFLWDKKPYVFMIKSKLIADSFKHYFKFLWTTVAKK